MENPVAPDTARSAAAKPNRDQSITRCPGCGMWVLVRLLNNTGCPTCQVLRDRF